MSRMLSASISCDNTNIKNTKKIQKYKNTNTKLPETQEVGIGLKDKRRGVVCRMLSGSISCDNTSRWDTLLEITSLEKQKCEKHNNLEALFPSQETKPMGN